LNITPPAFTIAEIRAMAMVDERIAHESRVNLDQLRRIIIAVGTLIAVFVGAALLSANVNYGHGNVSRSELDQDLSEQDTVPFKAFKSFSRPPVRKHIQLNQVFSSKIVIYDQVCEYVTERWPGQFKAVSCQHCQYCGVHNKLQQHIH
jgi:hypothetical protein